ncbi:hypothetical protein [Microcystis phage Mel-JY01]
MDNTKINFRFSPANSTIVKMENEAPSECGVHHYIYVEHFSIESSLRSIIVALNQSVAERLRLLITAQLKNKWERVRPYFCINEKIIGIEIDHVSICRIGIYINGLITTSSENAKYGFLIEAIYSTNDVESILNHKHIQVYFP